MHRVRFVRDGLTWFWCYAQDWGGAMTTGGHGVCPACGEVVETEAVRWGA